jgi:acyl-CoA dehydrogenase
MFGFPRSIPRGSLGIARRPGQIGTARREASVAEDHVIAPDRDGYAAIARAEATLVERSGLLGEGVSWAGRRMVARFFIAGFGNEEQRAAWLPRLALDECVASVAISEPRVGAHPKLLTTQAETDGDGFRITGEKAWVTNGPLAAVFVVLAVIATEHGRKRYGAFLVPRDTPGLTIREAPEYQALLPSRHCGVVLDRCHVPASALLGPPGSAYEAMALPFRDVEDAVGTFGLLGAFRFLLAVFGKLGDVGDEAMLSLGGMAALTGVFAAAAEAVVAALDSERLAGAADALVGLRILAAEMLQRARAHREAFGPASDAAALRALGDIETSLSVARGPRLARQARLGTQLAADSRRSGDAA